jgi:DNA polymerase
VDLFGNPVATPRPAGTGPGLAADALDLPLPSHHAPLHPRDIAARAGILAASLPVLDGIAGEARACRRCGLCETRTNAVPGVGSARSGIVFVGEAPGADEDAQGEPFVGRAGQLLTKIIEAMDRERLIPDVKLTRETVYICNVPQPAAPRDRKLLALPRAPARCAQAARDLLPGQVRGRVPAGREGHDRRDAG